MDVGRAVVLMDADLDPITPAHILRAVVDSRIDAVLIDHSGSTSADPTVVVLVQKIKAALPQITVF